MYRIAAFYEFREMGGRGRLEVLCEDLSIVMADGGILGTIILAEEGFNGTVCGKPFELELFLKIAGDMIGTVIHAKYSDHEEMPFRRREVKIKPEIVTLKKEVDIRLGEGTHVSPEEWNELIRSEDVVVLDDVSLDVVEGDHAVGEDEGGVGHRGGVRGRALAVGLQLVAEVEARAQLVVISTTGDRVQDRRLLEIGGKGLFTKEIEEALLAGRIDIAVHSSKDMPTVLPEGLALSAFLPREDPRDAFIGKTAKSIMELPQGATVGSSSLRRQALILRMRPDIKVVSFRGNVQTRLRKLHEGVADGTILALAGLNRLDLDRPA